MTIMTLKRIVAIKDVSIHISTFPSPYPGNVGHHNHHLSGPSVLVGEPYGISPFLASQRVPASDPSLACAHSPHLKLGNGSNTICNTSPQ
jgi:hypothetical protein